MLAFAQPPLEAERAHLEDPAEALVRLAQAVDLLDKASVVRALADLRPAAVYHCAGATHVGRAWSNTEAAVRRFFVSASFDPAGPVEEQDVDYRAALG